MTSPTDCPVCARRPRRAGAMTCAHCPQRITANLRELRDLYPLLHAATTPGQGDTGPHVTGSREPGVPLLLDVVDLTAHARGGTIHDPYRDQTGQIPIASSLDEWVQELRKHRRVQSEGRPVPTVPILAQWLADRIDDACWDFDGIGALAAEVWLIVCQIRTALHISRRPEHLHVPCPTCDMLSLRREPGGDHVECRNCGRLWTETEYARLAVVAAEVAKGEAA